MSSKHNDGREKFSVTIVLIIEGHILTTINRQKWHGYNQLHAFEKERVLRSNDYPKSKLQDQIQFFKTCRLRVTIIWPIWKILSLVQA